MFHSELEITSNMTALPRVVGAMSSEKVIVAVKAEKVITKTALAWALTHVVHPGDCITLLAVFPGEKTGKLTNFSTFKQY